ncbi:MAG: acyl-CoA dehydrogenase family protein [Caldilineaceae bacterium]
MDFQIPAPLVALKGRVRALVEEELIPLEPACLHTDFRELLPRLDAVRAKVKAEGLWAPFMPAAWGGMGLTLLEYALVAEELSRSLLGRSPSTARRRMWATWRSCTRSAPRSSRHAGSNRWSRARSAVASP